MFIYPLLVELHIFNLSPFGTGLFFGGTIHESEGISSPKH